MKPGIIILTLGIVLLSTLNSVAQHTPKSPEATQNRMNFFVISKPKKLLDPPTRFNILRAKIKSLLKPKKFSCIVASSADEMSMKIQYRLKKFDAVIGSLWFDSHGSYAKGYSFFTIGHDEFNFATIHDSEKITPFLQLENYCDSKTRIGIGSCYGGATYSKPRTGTSAQMPMNGDSLMKGMGMIFSEAIIYACESWVMTKPGLFKEKFAMAGFPLRKKFKDVSFEPAWNRLGMWNSYQFATNEMKAVNCVTLTKYGNIVTRHNSYQSLKRIQKRIANNKEKLRPNILKA